MHPCVALLQLLLERTQTKAQDSDTATQLRQLQSIAYTLQLVEAAIRQQAVWISAKMEASEGDKSTLQQYYRSCYTAGFFVAETAVDFIPKADWAVVSLQGQQLLQSSTSLLLTCNSMLLSWSDAAFPGTLSLCVRGLPLLHLAAA